MGSLPIFSRKQRGSGWICPKIKHKEQTKTKTKEEVKVRALISAHKIGSPIHEPGTFTMSESWTHVASKDRGYGVQQCLELGVGEESQC